jgi:mono/diheme cytochrome c family protein
MNRPTFAVLSFSSLLLLSFGCGGGEKPATTTTASSSAAPAPTESAPAADPVALAAKGKELYGQNCVTCHGASGKGDGPAGAALTPKPRNFTDAAYMDKLTDSDVRNTVKYGGGIKGMPQMPSNPQYNDADLSALVAYVRTFSHPK